jgi:tRNA A-37 threonylcarbamoyl transferase component Bud32
LHDLCAREAHAPWILGYERLPGGWFAVAMEYFEGSTSITHSDLLTRHRDHWTKYLMRLVKRFHAAGFVHGDLWDENILCKDDNVVLVDFDWGGKVGEATYPTLDLHPELLEGRTSSSLKITKDDDMRVLMKTLDKLQLHSP